MRYLRLLSALLFLLLNAGAFAEQQWTEIHSPHFTVITDAGEKRGREVALRFEQIHDSFGAILKKVKVNSPIPVTIFAFKNNKELTPFCPLYKGKPISLAGFFQQGQDRDYIIVDLSSEGGWHVVYHEYGHLLLHTNSPPVPAWFDEGFAEYFASIRVDGKSLYFGEMTDAQQYILYHNNWMKSGYMFAIDQHSPEYNEKGDHRSSFYAQSWLMFHYMMDKNEMTEAATFLNAVMDKHVPIPKAFQDAFGMSPEGFDKALHDYFSSTNQMHYFRQPAPAGMAEGSYTAKVISPLDAQAHMADLHFHEMDYREHATEEFQAILQKDPNNAVANRGLAFAEMTHGQRDEALEHIRKAVATDPNDAHSHYLYAHLLSTKLGFGGDEDSNATAETMLAQAQAAVAINPELADAYELIGRAQLQKHNNTAAHDAFVKAINLNPANEGYRFNLANYYMSLRNWDAAKQVLRPLANLPNSSFALMSQNQIASIERMQQQEKAGPVEWTRKAEDEEAAGSTAPVGPPAVVHFAKGKLVRVDCSSEPGAKFVVEVSGKQWTFATSDRKKLVLLGEDNVSCDWKDRKVAVNYRDHGDNAGDLVSLEMQ